jgi:hypothetical protein
MDVHQQSSTHAVLLQSWPTPTSITAVGSLLLPSSCSKVFILTVEMLSCLQLCVATHSCQPQAHSGSLSAQPQYYVAFELLGLYVFNDPASSCGRTAVQKFHLAEDVVLLHCNYCMRRWVFWCQLSLPHQCAGCCPLTGGVWSSIPKKLPSNCN